jgi:hypothetical protein
MVDVAGPVFPNLEYLSGKNNFITIPMHAKTTTVIKSKLLLWDKPKPKIPCLFIIILASNFVLGGAIII